MEVVPNDLAVDSAGDAVLQLEVHLGDGVVGEDGGVRDITWKANARVSFKPNCVFDVLDPCALLSKNPFHNLGALIT